MKNLRNYLGLLCTAFALAASTSLLSHKVYQRRAEQQMLSGDAFNDGIRYGAPYEFTLRGVLFKAGSRDRRSLDSMSDDDKRNTVIVEVKGGSLFDSRLPDLQRMKNDELIGYHAAQTLLRECKIRTPQELTKITLRDQVNTIIAETNARLGIAVGELQRKSVIDLVKTALQWRDDFFAIENVYDIKFNLAAANAEKTPQVVKQEVYENFDSTSELRQKFEYTKRIQKSSSFSFTSSSVFSLSHSTQVEAGLPMFGAASTSLTVGFQQTFEFTKQETMLQEASYTVTSDAIVQPGKGIRIEAILYRGVMNIPYTATIETKSGHRYKIEGTWKSVEAFDYRVAQRDIKRV